MHIKKALITAAGPDQRKLVLQTLVDIYGCRKTVLEILIEEARQAGIEEIGIVIHPGDYNVFSDIFSNDKQIQLIIQEEALGYGHAILCGKSFVSKDYFLHLVGDHLYVNRSKVQGARQLIETAKQQCCSVSTVTQTRESLIPNFGTIGGNRIHPTTDLYAIQRVVEKPTPTIAEQELMISGLRAGYYLCFFGMHVLSPSIMSILERNLVNAQGGKIGLTDALNELAQKEKYVALEKSDMRFDIGDRYGLMMAQIAIALSGKDRDQVLSELLEFFTMKSQNTETI